MWIWVILILVVVIVVLIMNISVLMTKVTFPTPTAPSPKLGTINIILLAAIVIFIIIIAFVAWGSCCPTTPTYVTGNVTTMVPVAATLATPVVVAASGPRNMDCSVFDM